MFTEILRIKPILDKAGAAAMDASLSKRFSSIAKRFGAGLKNVIKGSVIGISLGLLAKILNPLEEIENKIKDLMGQGTDLKDLADRFNTTGGKLSRVEAIGKSLGVKPEELRDLLTKYAQAVEKGRLELLNPAEAPSQATLALSKTGPNGQNFLAMSDKLESFFLFVQSLKQFGETANPIDTKLIPLVRSARDKRMQGKSITEEERLALVEFNKQNMRSGLDARAAVETDIFGEPLHGAAKRFINADMGEQFGKLRLPPLATLDRSIDKFANLDTRRDVQETHNQTADFVKASQLTTGKMVDLMIAAENRDNAFTTKQIATYEALNKGAQAVTDIKEGMQDLLSKLTVLLGYLGTITNWIPKLMATKWWRGIGGGT